MRTKGEGAKAARLAVQSYETQSRFFETEANQTANDAGRLQGEYRAVLEQLAGAILPAADPERVAHVGQALGEPRLSQQREHWGARVPGFQTRLQQLAQEPDVINREALLDPHSGELVVQLQQANQRKNKAEQVNSPFLEDDFQWVIQRENQKAEGVSLVQGFLRAVTFAETREKRAKKKLVSKFGAQDWDSLHRAYEDSVRELYAATDEVKAVSERRERLEALLAEGEDLNRWVNHFERRLAVEIQNMVLELLPFCDPMALRKIPGQHKILTSKAHALKAKLKYLNQLEEYLKGEAQDRQTRARKIDRVRRLWEAKPYGLLAGDKTKWLVTVPAMKEKSTAKRARWSSKMRRGIVEYDDYDSYDYYYDSYEDSDGWMLPYDVFAHGFEERMPYEGFSGEVLSDIGEHRQAHSLEKADYSHFRELDKQERTDEADVEAEELAAIALAAEAAAAAEEAAEEAALEAAESSAEGFADAS